VVEPFTKYGFTAVRTKDDDVEFCANYTFYEPHGEFWSNYKDYCWLNNGSRTAFAYTYVINDHGKFSFGLCEAAIESTTGEVTASHWITDREDRRRYTFGTKARIYAT
jgi:hypothetical protein